MWYAPSVCSDLVLNRVKNCTEESKGLWHAISVKNYIENAYISWEATTTLYSLCSQRDCNPPSAKEVVILVKDRTCDLYTAVEAEGHNQFMKLKLNVTSLWKSKVFIII
jgi:hypothetical protein